MVSKSPKQGNVPLPNGLNGLSMGVTNHYIHWDDPPSRVCFPKRHVQKDFTFPKLVGLPLQKEKRRVFVRSLQLNLDKTWSTG